MSSVPPPESQTPDNPTPGTEGSSVATNAVTEMDTSADNNFPAATRESASQSSGADPKPSGDEGEQSAQLASASASSENNATPAGVTTEVNNSNTENKEEKPSGSTSPASKEGKASGSTTPANKEGKASGSTIIKEDKMTTKTGDSDAKSMEVATPDGDNKNTTNNASSPSDASKHSTETGSGQDESPPTKLQHRLFHYPRGSSGARKRSKVRDYDTEGTKKKQKQPERKEATEEPTKNATTDEQPDCDEKPDSKAVEDAKVDDKDAEEEDKYGPEGIIKGSISNIVLRRLGKLDPDELIEDPFSRENRAQVEKKTDEEEQCKEAASSPSKEDSAQQQEEDDDKESQQLNPSDPTSDSTSRAPVRVNLRQGVDPQPPPEQKFCTGQTVRLISGKDKGLIGKIHSIGTKGYFRLSCEGEGGTSERTVCESDLELLDKSRGAEADAPVTGEKSTKQPTPRRNKMDVQAFYLHSLDKYFEVSLESTKGKLQRLCEEYNASMREGAELFRHNASGIAVTPDGRRVHWKELAIVQAQKKEAKRKKEKRLITECRFFSYARHIASEEFTHYEEEGNKRPQSSDLRDES